MTPFIPSTPSALAPDSDPPHPQHPQAQEQSPCGHRGETGEGVDGALPFRNSQSEAGDTTLDKQPEDLSGAQRSSAGKAQALGSDWPRFEPHFCYLLVGALNLSEPQFPHM